MHLQNKNLTRAILKLTFRFIWIKWFSLAWYSPHLLPHSFLYESINIKFEELYPLPAPVARLQTSKQIFWGNMERKIFILILSSRRRHELQPEFRNATTRHFSTQIQASHAALSWSSWHGHLVLLQKFPNKCLDGGEVN